MEKVHRLRGLPAFRQPGAEIDAGNVIVFCHRQRVPEKGLVISPIAQLISGLPRAGGKHDGGQKKGRWFRHTPVHARLAHAPDQNHEHANQRQICVAVGHGLVADLNQADDGNQHPDKPKPADRRKGKFLSPPDRGDAKDGKQCRGKQHQPQRPMPRMRIWTGQRGRPKHLAQIPGIGNKRIFDPLRHGISGQRGHRAAFLLHDERHNARSRAQDEKRPFLENQLVESCRLRSPPSALRAPPERPPVQQQHHKRQRDQHRLAHQTQPEENHRQPIKL